MLKTSRIFLIVGVVSLVFYVGIITEFYIYEVKPDLEMEVLQKLSFRETKSHVDRGGGVPALSLKADSLLPSEHGPVLYEANKNDKNDKNTSLDHTQPHNSPSQSDLERHHSTLQAQKLSAREKNSRSDTHPPPDPVRVDAVNLSVTVQQITPDHIKGDVDSRQKDTLSCKLPNCIDALDASEQNQVRNCERTAIRYVGHELEAPKCRFLKSQTRREPVALNSQEGSGNTWLRGLLERATGICTGFYTCDPETRARGFLGEGIKSGHVLVVKTHVHIPQWIGGKRDQNLAYDSTYGSAVYLIRNPANGVIAEWNRLSTIKSRSSKDTHINVVSKEAFETDEWIRFSGKYIDRWKERTINWVLDDHRRPVHVVSYEDLKNNTVKEVEKILDFLKYPYNHNELVEKLSQDFNEFRRSHTQDDFPHFNSEQKQKLRSTLESITSIAKSSGKIDLFHFYEYLQSI